MPRRLFKRYMPDPEDLKGHPTLRHLGQVLHDPNLWHLNRHSVSRAMAMGLFAAFIPIPMQMLLAASLAVISRANLPISISRGIARSTATASKASPPAPRSLRAGAHLSPTCPPIT